MFSPSQIYFNTPSANILNIVHVLANIRETEVASSLLFTGSTREMWSEIKVVYSGISHEVVDFTAANVCVYCLNINHKYCNKNYICVLHIFKHVNSINTCWRVNFSKITVSEVCTCANTDSDTRESDLPHKSSQDERGALPGRCRNLTDSPPRPYRLGRWTASPGTVGQGVKLSVWFQSASSRMRGTSATQLHGEVLTKRSSFSL